MIEVKAIHDNQGICRSLSVTGHSGLREKGSDILCASVSILVMTLYATLMTKKSVSVSGNACDSGSFLCSINEIPKVESSWVKGVLDTFFVGISMLEKEFPDRLTIKIQ